MACILKTNQTYTAPTGEVYEQAYLIARSCGHDKEAKKADYIVKIYPSAQLKNANKMPLEAFHVRPTADEFDEYFELDGVNIIAQCYIHLLSDETRSAKWQQD